jgi:hypothetical protein
MTCTTVHDSPTDDENVRRTNGEMKSCLQSPSIDDMQINHREIRHTIQTSRHMPFSDLISRRINWNQLEIHPKVTLIFSQGPILENSLNYLKNINNRRFFFKNSGNCLENLDTQRYWKSPVFVIF